MRGRGNHSIRAAKWRRAPKPQLAIPDGEYNQAGEVVARPGKRGGRRTHSRWEKVLPCRTKPGEESRPNDHEIARAPVVRNALRKRPQEIRQQRDGANASADTGMQRQSIIRPPRKAAEPSPQAMPTSPKEQKRLADDSCLDFRISHSGPRCLLFLSRAALAAFTFHPRHSHGHHRRRARKNSSGSCLWTGKEGPARRRGRILAKNQCRRLCPAQIAISATGRHA